MVTRNLLKQEIDRVREEHLTALYNIIKVFALPAGTILSASDGTAEPATDRSNREKFIEKTYGCLKDDSIERGRQGGCQCKETIKELREFRHRHRLDGLSIREMIAERKGIFCETEPGTP